MGWKNRGLGDFLASHSLGTPRAGSVCPDGLSLLDEGLDSFLPILQAQVVHHGLGGEVVCCSKVLRQLFVKGSLAQRDHGAAQGGDLLRYSHGFFLQLLLWHHFADEAVAQGLLSRNGLPSKQHLQGHLTASQGGTSPSPEEAATSAVLYSRGFCVKNKKNLGRGLTWTPDDLIERVLESDTPEHLEL